jgi:prepilin-type N-terminal cleavage/methylation domain-containing protein
MRLLKFSQAKGFTLIEIVVTLGIMAIILTVGSFGSNIFNSKANLNSAAELMTSDLRTTALMAVNAQQFQDQITSGWGVYLDTATNSYTVFADLDNNSVYNNKEKFKTVKLPRNIIINNLQFKGNNLNQGSLYFQANNATPFFEAVSFSSDPYNLNIQLSNKETSDVVSIYVNSLGMVNLQ